MIMNVVKPVVVECLSCNINQIFLFPRQDILTVLECQSCFQSGVIHEGNLIPIEDLEKFLALDTESAKEYLIDIIVKFSYSEFSKYIGMRYSSKKKDRAKRTPAKFTANNAMAVVGKSYSKDEQGMREIEDDFFAVGIKVNSFQKDRKLIPEDIQKEFEALKYLYETFKRFIKEQ